METKSLEDLNDTFVLDKESLIATLSDETFNGNAQIFFRTPDGKLYPIGVALKNKKFGSVIELTDVGTAKKLLGLKND